MGKPRSCENCTREVRPGHILCTSCGDRLADYLVDVPDLDTELAASYARWDDIGVVSGRGGDLDLPYKHRAGEARTLLRSTVLYWACELARVHRSPWCLPNTLVEMAQWLHHRLDWLCMLDTAPEAYADIDRAVKAARAAIDRPTHRTQFPVGPCPEIRDAHYCLGEVWAYIPTRPVSDKYGTDTAVMRCHAPECRRHTEPWLPESWREAGKRILRRKARQRKERTCAVSTT